MLGLNSYTNKLTVWSDTMHKVICLITHERAKEVFH